MTIDNSDGISFCLSRKLHFEPLAFTPLCFQFQTLDFCETDEVWEIRTDASDNGRRGKVNKRVSSNVNISVRFYLISVQFCVIGVRFYVISVRIDDFEGVNPKPLVGNQNIFEIRNITLFSTTYQKNWSKGRWALRLCPSTYLLQRWYAPEPIWQVSVPIGPISETTYLQYVYALLQCPVV